MSFDALDDDWVVWSDEREKAVLAYRPDVFDGGRFPAPCMPTIYLTRGQRGRRPGNQRMGADWHVTLFLEPDVEVTTASYPGRERAVEGAVSHANEFANGEMELAEVYQVPREEYVEKLEALTGTDDRSA